MRKMSVISALLIMGVSITHADTVLVPTEKPTIQEALTYLAGFAIPADPHTVIIEPGVVEEAGIIVPPELVRLIIRGQTTSPQNHQILPPAGDEDRIFHIDYEGNNVYLQFEYLSINGLQSQTPSGGMYIDESIVSFSNVRFSENTRDNDDGGAVKSLNSELSFEYCVFEDNKADNSGEDNLGGAIYSSFSQVHLYGCDFSDNIADNGGAVHASNTYLTVDLSIFEGNIANFTDHT